MLRTTSLPNIRLALRPGTYEAGFFLNANEQNWNPDIEPGFVVSEKEEITPEDDLPYAYTYLIQKNSGFVNYNQIMLNEEPFCRVDLFYRTEKRYLLQQTGPIPRQTLILKRKATRFRYLLRHTKVEAGNNYYIEFGQTAHYLRAQFKVSPETPFCQGLNILGGGYYPRDSLLTSVVMNISTSGSFYTSSVDGLDYQMCIPANSTYLSYYLLMDKSVPDGSDEITDIFMAGQSDKPAYAYNGSIKRRFWLNRISGVVFELTPDIKEIMNGRPVYYIKEITDADAVGLFDPYFELNPKR